MNITSPIYNIERVRNKFSSMYNKLRFFCYGVKFGKGFCIYGHPGIWKGKNAIFSIGEGFFMSNENHHNPLARNIQGGFHVNDNAELIIGDCVGISSVTIWCHKSITIGNNVNIGANTTILDSDCHSMDYLIRKSFKKDQQHKKDLPIVIEDDVLIGMNCIILKGVTIGARSVVGAGSVVTRNIPPNCIVAGNPARIIKALTC